MQDNRPHNNQGQKHGYWMVHHSNNNLWYNGYYLNGEHYGCFEYWSWNNDSSIKHYNAR